VPKWRRGEEYAGFVTRVCDGDTIVVLWEGAGMAVLLPERVRLSVIQAPELQPVVQPGAVAAKLWLSDLVLARTVYVWPARAWPDRYGRLIARVLVGGVDVGAALLAAGLVTIWRRRKRR
jgi:endonuclease YncB( thermonuclease family)